MSDRYVVRYRPTNGVVSKPASKMLAEKVAEVMNKKVGLALYVVEEWGWPE